MCYLLAGPGQGPGGLLDGREEVGAGGCHTGWTQLLTAPYPGMSLSVYAISLISFPNIRWLFPEKRCWDVQLRRGQKEMVASCPAFPWAVGHPPALSIFPWRNHRVCHGTWPGDSFSSKMSLNLSCGDAKPSAACPGHSLKIKAGF